MSPLYTAVMECVPAVSVEVVNVADPATKALLPIVVVPSLKVIVPEGVPVPIRGVTFAVKVTEFPKIEGLIEEVSVVLHAP